MPAAERAQHNVVSFFVEKVPKPRPPHGLWKLRYADIDGEPAVGFPMRVDLNKCLVLDAFEGFVTILWPRKKFPSQPTHADSDDWSFFKNAQKKAALCYVIRYSDDLLEPVVQLLTQRMARTNAILAHLRGLHVWSIAERDRLLPLPELDETIARAHRSCEKLAGDIGRVERNILDLETAVALCRNYSGNQVELLGALTRVYIIGNPIPNYLQERRDREFNDWIERESERIAREGGSL